MNGVKPGIYRHYKGSDYRVFGTCRHSESEEVMVFYQCLYGDHRFWVRPLSLFQETVEVQGATVPRFRFLQPLSEADESVWAGGVS
jgi:hypothetical protein